MARLLKAKRQAGQKLHLAIEQPQRFLDRNCPFGYRSALSASMEFHCRDERLADPWPESDFVEGSKATRMSHINSHQWSTGGNCPKPGETSTANASLEQMETYSRFGVLRVEKCELTPIGSFMASQDKTIVYVHPREEAKFKSMAEQAWANCVRKTGPRLLQAGS